MGSYGYVISRNRRWLHGSRSGSCATVLLYKKTPIVAFARKPLVARRKYVTADVVIEGAVMKAA
jgi:hypothetical protein